MQLTLLHAQNGDALSHIYAGSRAMNSSVRPRALEPLPSLPLADASPRARSSSGRAR